MTFLDWLYTRYPYLWQLQAVWEEEGHFGAHPYAAAAYAEYTRLYPPANTVIGDNAYINGQWLVALTYTGDAYAGMSYDEQIRLSHQWHPAAQQLYQSAVRGPDGRLYVTQKAYDAAAAAVYQGGDVVTDILDDYAVAIGSVAFGGIMAAHAAATAAATAAESAAESVAPVSEIAEAYDYSWDGSIFDTAETVAESAPPVIDAAPVPVQTSLPDWFPDIKVPDLSMNTVKQVISAAQVVRAVTSGGTAQRPPITQRLPATYAQDTNYSQSPPAVPFLAIGAALLAVLALR